MGAADDRLADDMLKAALGGGLPVVPPHIRISIPKSHPKAEAFVKLARTLASEKHLESGVIVKGLARPDAEKEILDALADIIGRDTLDSFLDRLAKARPTPRVPRSSGEMLGLVGRLLPVLVQHGAADKTKLAS